MRTLSTDGNSLVAIGSTVASHPFGACKIHLINTFFLFIFRFQTCPTLADFLLPRFRLFRRSRYTPTNSQ